MRSRVLALAALLTLLVGPTLAAASAPQRGLPSILAEATAASDGALVYVFGGAAGAVGNEPALTDQILRFEPVNGTVETLSVKLPSARGGAPAVWTGHEFLLFGGWAGRDKPLDDIIRFDPATMTVRTSAAKLPTGLAEAAVVWTGRDALVFGGYTSCDARCPIMSAAVLRYDPARDNVTSTSARLPVGFASQAAFWQDGNAYLLGGYGANGTGTSTTDLVFRYNDSSDAVSLVPTRLPLARQQAAVAVVDRKAYLLGGTGLGTQPAGDILRFDPARENASFTGVTLNVKFRTLTAGAQVGPFAYLIGGVGCPTAADFCNDILVYDLADANPRFVESIKPEDRTATKAATPDVGVVGAVVALGVALALRRR